jgi:hypothetical protein
MSQMNAFSLDEYEELVNRLSREHPEWRLGQAYFNALHRIRADLSIKVRGQDGLDPFHSNGNIRAFKSWLRANWEDDE